MKNAAGEGNVENVKQLTWADFKFQAKDPSDRSPAESRGKNTAGVPPAEPELFKTTD